MGLSRAHGLLALIARAHDEPFVFVVGDALRRDALHHPHVGADDRVLAEPCAPAEDRGVCIDGHVVLDVGVAFDAFDRVAVIIDLERLRAERHALVDFDVVADARGLADDDAGAVVDEEMVADLRPRVDVAAGFFVRVLGDEAGNEGHAQFVEDVGDALQRDHEHAGVGEDDLVDAARGRISIVGGGDVGVRDAADVGKLAEQLHRQPLGVFFRLGIAREPQALGYLGGESAGDIA